MSDATIFIVLFGGLFVLRIVAATIVFYYILPRGDRCPNCDAPTVRVRFGPWHRIAPFLRSSWCLHCGWEGMLRPGAAPASIGPAVGGRRGDDAPRLTTDPQTRPIEPRNP